MDHDLHKDTDIALKFFHWTIKDWHGHKVLTSPEGKHERPPEFSRIVRETRETLKSVVPDWAKD